MEPWMFWTLLAVCLLILIGVVLIFMCTCYYLSNDLTLLSNNLESVEKDVKRTNSRFDDLVIADKLLRDAEIMMKDKNWRLDYVSNLSADNHDAAFLPDEEIDGSKNSIETATRRAFPGTRLLRIEEYEKGTITGTVRVLLPQGKYQEFRFNNEKGWKAKATFLVNGEEKSYTLYYRSKCMNPIRRREVQGVESDVQFTPGNRPNEAESIGKMDDSFFNQNIGFLKEYYKDMANTVQREGTIVSIRDNGNRISIEKNGEKRYVTISGSGYDTKFNFYQQQPK